MYDFIIILDAYNFIYFISFEIVVIVLQLMRWFTIGLGNNRFYHTMKREKQKTKDKKK